MSELLQGVRVIEIGILFNGDTLGMLLGDLGADVVKVEAPPHGDYLRVMHGQLAPGWSPTHLQANKNKRSLALDLRTEAGREVFWRLLDTADVFVDGLMAGACERLGIGYAQQRERRPEIIYCHHSGYGAEGPYAKVPTHGVMPLVLAGARPLEKGDDGLYHYGRSKDLLGGTGGAGECTHTGALYAALHVAAALFWRKQSGRGVFLDVASADAALASSFIGLVINANRQRLTTLDGMPSSDGTGFRGAKYQYYETRDGKVLLFCCMEHKFWRGFCRAVGREDLAGDVDSERPFDFGVELGAEKEAELIREMQQIFRTRTLAEWMHFAEEHDLPMGPAYSRVDEVLQDPHVRARGLLFEGEHPVAGPFTYIGEPVKVAEQPYRVRHPAPAAGQHNEELLRELGYGEAELQALHRSGVA